MLAGNQSMPTKDGTRTQTGNSGAGYARITFLEGGDVTDLYTDKGEFDQKYTETNEEYTKTVSSDTSKITIEVETVKDLTTTGIGEELDLNYGYNEFNITYLKENGTLVAHKIIIYRSIDTESNSNLYLEKFEIDSYAGYINPNFDSNVFRHDIVSYTDTPLQYITAVANDRDAEVDIEFNAIEEGQSKGSLVVTLSKTGFPNTIYKFSYAVNTNSLGETG